MAPAASSALASSLKVGLGGVRVSGVKATFPLDVVGTFRHPTKSFGDERSE